MSLDDLESLLARDAESMVIFFPMLQVGCLSASIGVTWSSSSFGRSRRLLPTRQNDVFDLIGAETMIHEEHRRMLRVYGKMGTPFSSASLFT
jgi:hypothetical protein